MSKKARDHRARFRNEERYLDGRAKPDDEDYYHYGWNKSRSRSVRKWERQEGQLLFQDSLKYLNWYHFATPLLHKGRKP